MKAFALFTALLTGLLCLGAGAFIVGYVTIVDQTIPQMPSWAQGPVEDWMLDIPQDSEALDLNNDGVPDSRNNDTNSSDDSSGGGGGSISALPGPTSWGNYTGSFGIP